MDRSVVADRGYYRAEEIEACAQAGITAYVPTSTPSGNEAKGQFDRSEFRYDARADEYECPAGERLIYRFSRVEAEKMMRRYWSSACASCPIKAKCTTGKYRLVSRWENEAVLDRAEARLDVDPNVMRLRRATVEHPFGTFAQHESLKPKNNALSHSLGRYLTL